MEKQKNKKVNKMLGGNRFRPYNEEFKNASVGADSISAQDHKDIDNVNGITLIALVITIILLLILAGVVLNLTIRRTWNIKTGTASRRTV